MKQFCFTIITVILSALSAFAQASDVAMADQMRTDGKIYVVVAVLGTILLGFLGYVVFLDKKITKIEEQIKKEGK